MSRTPILAQLLAARRRQNAPADWRASATHHAAAGAATMALRAEVGEDRWARFQEALRPAARAFKETGDLEAFQAARVRAWEGLLDGASPEEAARWLGLEAVRLAAFRQALAATGYQEAARP